VKELVDALRDRRTLMMVLLSSVAVGPVLLLVLSFVVGSIEERAEQRQVYAAGIEHAPSLRNFIERQTFTVREAPADYAAQLRAKRFRDPVIVVPRDFERELVAGNTPVVDVVFDSVNRDAAIGAGRVHRLLEGYARERASLSLALRGVAGELLAPIEVQSVDLASASSRATQLTAMLPFFVLMAVLYGALNAALDSTAGERERGSLEPLLMTPPERIALVLGKWGAVACLGMGVALLCCLSFLPGQWLLRSDTLAAMFRFGVGEAVGFLAVLMPLAAAVSAVLMAVAIRCKTFKEAQASSTGVILAMSLLPIVTVFDAAQANWHLLVPGLAQSQLMTLVLKGQTLTAPQVLVPLAACITITAVALWDVTRTLRSAALKG
jgi:sodium transport system permease protein